MKLGDNTLNNEDAHICKHKITDKICTNCSPYFTALQCNKNLEIKRSYKRKVNLMNLRFFYRAV